MVTWIWFFSLLWTTPVPSLGDSTRPSHPCSAGYDKYTFCDISLSREDRIASLLNLLTPEEKISLLGNTASPGVPRLGLPPYEWWNEALHGVGKSPGIHFDPHAGTGHATSFPQVCTLGPSFNRTLFGIVGNAIGQEARAFYNVHRGGLTYWAPNVNIFRDPRWGRGQEVPGEDPFLNGQYAISFVKGLQWGEVTSQQDLHDEDQSETSTVSTYPRVAAACKHFAAYSLEDGRFSFSATIHDPRDMEDSYLPAFDVCVRQAKAMGVMCSYNAINGVPSCANAALLKVLLRDEWQFDGYVTGDCGAVENVQVEHLYTNDTAETCQVVLRSGVDIDCGVFLQHHGVEAFHKSMITVEDLDKALWNLFLVQMKLGYFDPLHVNPWNKIDTSVIGSEEHGAIALDAARQGLVLLKNGNEQKSDDDEISPPLPLSLSQHRTIALIGPNANATVGMLGNYYGIPPLYNSPLGGFSNILGAENVLYQKGCTIQGNETILPNAICSDAHDADAVILVMGLNQDVEAESLDRMHLHWPGEAQHEVIQQAKECAKEGAPVVLVIMGGGPVDVRVYKEDVEISAIVYVGYPGEYGGLALAEVVYGMYNPSGRLTTTIYPIEFTDEVSITDMGMRPNATSGNPGRTYRFYTGDAVYPFGHGMSYTSFEYKMDLITADWQEKQTKTASMSDVVLVPSSLNISVNVTNTGQRKGSSSVLLFYAGPNAGTGGEPLMELVGFEKVVLNPLENTVVRFEVSSKEIFGMRYASIGEHSFFIGPYVDSVVSFHIKAKAKIDFS